MTTIYFSRRDYLEAMRDPHGAPRCHAVCRKLLGVASSYPSLWYGAHYYAACALLSRNYESQRAALAFWRKTFARECTGCDGRTDPPLSKAHRALWRLAVKRVRAVKPDALALSNSVLW